jgi:hypothetical protein
VARSEFKRTGMREPDVPSGSIAGRSELSSQGRRNGPRLFAAGGRDAVSLASVQIPHPDVIVANCNRGQRESIR